jgi:cyanophycin synthetase
LAVIERLKKFQRLLKTRARLHIVPYINDFRYGRMPVVMVTGSVGKTTTSRLVAAILKEEGHRVGLACTDGLYVDGEMVCKGDLSSYRGARRLFSRHHITAAVLETARGGLLTGGLFLKHRKVGALLNVGSEHIGVDGIDSLDAMALHKSRVVRGSRVAVLNGDDPRSAQFIDACGAQRVCLFSALSGAPDVDRVLAGGGKAVHADEEGYMVLASGAGARQRIVRISDIPITLNGRAAHYTANAMAAVAIADALGVPISVMASALMRFRGGMRENPGRWTTFDGYPFQLVAERGPNAAAFVWTLRMVKSLPVSGRRILLLYATGNRNDAQYYELTELAATEFDHFIAYENDAFRRGRHPGEVPALLEAGLLKAGVARDRVEKAQSLSAAMERASALVRPGDLILMLTNEAPESEPAVRKAFEIHANSTADTLGTPLRAAMMPEQWGPP